jgi:hypothetical protein
MNPNAGVRGGVMAALLVVVLSANAQTADPTAESAPAGEQIQEQAELPAALDGLLGEGAGGRTNSNAVPPADLILLWLEKPARGQAAGGAAGAAPAPAEASAEELAKKTQNPVSDLISVPFQYNANLGFEPNGRNQSVLNIQPVIPISLSENWNLITRVIVPVIYQPFLSQPSGGEGGLGDIFPTFFLSPAKPGKFIWGVGPALSLPTASDRLLGTGKWSAGPSFVVLKMSGPWVVGLLSNDVWSFAGDDGRPPVHQFLAQYFINYNMPKGWYLTSAPIITANWKAPSGNKWTVPFGGGFGRVFRVGKQPLNASIAAFGNPIRPEFGADWTVRFQLALLFPK